MHNCGMKKRVLQLKKETRQISGFKQRQDKAICIDMALCMAQGMRFYMSDNNVILTEGFGGVIEPKYFREIVDLRNVYLN